MLTAPCRKDPLLGDERIVLLFGGAVMPGGMNGCDLVRKARVVRRDRESLVTSGWANDVHKAGVRIDMLLQQRPCHHAEPAMQIRLALGHN